MRSLVTRDGTEAWHVLQREDAPPLAILDWMMPGLDGVDVCRQVRQSSQAPYVYIIMLTAKTDPHDLVQGMECGADDYLRKPFDEHELRVRLHAGKRIVELQAALRQQATHDALTGVWNRGTILAILQRELARSVRAGTSVSVIMADLDHKVKKLKRFSLLLEFLFSGYSDRLGRQNKRKWYERCVQQLAR